MEEEGLHLRYVPSAFSPHPVPEKREYRLVNYPDSIADTLDEWIKFAKKQRIKKLVLLGPKEKRMTVHVER